MEGRDMDIREKVEHPFPREKVQVTVQFESLCHSVHLKGLLDELNSNKQTHQSTESHLDSSRSFWPDRGMFLYAKRKIKHLNSNHYMIGGTVNTLLGNVDNMNPCVTYSEIDSEC